MKTKTIFAIFSALLLLMSTVYADSKPNVVVTGFKIKEGSANVGKDFTLQATLANIQSGTCAKDITTSIESGFPFIMKGVSTIPSGDLCADESRIAEFPMKVDPTANGGFYQVKISNTYQTSTYIQFSSSSTLNLFVDGSPEINANIISSEPIDIYPGDTGILTIKIENDGNFEAQSINFVLTAAKPVEVKWAKSQNSIEALEPRQSRTFEFAVEVPKNAEAKSYPLLLALTYFDENKAKQNKNFNFNLLVKKKAEFETSDDGSDSLYANTASRSVKLQLKNTGTDTARKIRAKILPQFPFSTDGSVRYIEILDVGKSEPVEFTVDVDKDATPGKYTLDMHVDFEDAQGKKLQDTTQVVLDLKSKDFFRSVFADFWYLWLVAAALATMMLRKKSKTKK